MRLSGKTIGFGITGSHCTIPEVIPEIQRFMDEGALVIPIISESVANHDTRFGKAAEIIETLKTITGRAPIASIVDAEPIGPSRMLDVMVVAPCTGNTLAKMALGITDSPVLMAAKAHLRNERPLVIGISTNDALGANARNLAYLMNVKNVYFVPFGQDSPTTKTKSMISNMALLVDTVVAALEGRQLQPVIVPYRG